MGFMNGWMGQQSMNESINYQALICAGAPLHVKSSVDERPIKLLSEIMTHDMFTESIMEAYGSMVALGFEFVLSSIDPEKEDIVRDDIIRFTRPCYSSRHDSITQQEETHRQHHDNCDDDDRLTDDDDDEDEEGENRMGASDNDGGGHDDDDGHHGNTSRSPWRLAFDRRTHRQLTGRLSSRILSLFASPRKAQVSERITDQQSQYS